MIEAIRLLAAMTLMLCLAPFAFIGILASFGIKSIWDWYTRA
jgi:hypothetical protein